MDERAYRAWWPLHLRVAKGEKLTDQELALYAEGKRRLHEEDVLDGSVALLRKTREDVRRLELERQRLQKRRRQLRAKVSALEAALSEKAKQALGVGD